MNMILLTLEHNDTPRNLNLINEFSCGEENGLPLSKAKQYALTTRSGRTESRRGHAAASPFGRIAAIGGAGPRQGPAGAPTAVCGA
jgi:hypothetical protein